MTLKTMLALSSLITKLHNKICFTVRKCDMVDQTTEFPQKSTAMVVKGIFGSCYCALKLRIHGLYCLTGYRPLVATDNIWYHFTTAFGSIKCIKKLSVGYLFVENASS